MRIKNALNAPYSNKLNNVMPANVRELNRYSGTMARSPNCLWTQTKPPKMTNASTAAARASASRSGETVAVVNDQVKAASATAANAPPTTSSGRLIILRSAGTYRIAKTIDSAATGAVNKKMARQWPVSISQPPSTGPIALAIAAVAAHKPIAPASFVPE